jgi:hypothetical protein
LGLRTEIHRPKQFTQTPQIAPVEIVTHAHPYDPQQKVLEAFVQQQTPGAYRVFWCYGPEKRQITLIAITPHP